MSARSLLPAQWLLPVALLLVGAPPQEGAADDDPIAAKIAILRDGSIKDRVRAARELATFGKLAEPAIPVLIGLLGDGDEALRAEVSAALGKIGSAAVPALVTAFQRGNERVQIGAARALAAMGGKAKPAAAVLAEALVPKSSAHLRLEIARTLGEIGDPASVKPLTEVLTSDPKYWVRGEAASALGGLGPQAAGATGPLLQLLRAACTVRTRGNSLPPETNAVELILQVTGALKRIGAKAVPQLVEALQDPDPWVRKHILATLADMGEQAVPAVPAMTDCLKHADVETRCDAAECLGWLERHAKSAVPELEKSFGDPSHSVRVQAASAVLRIEPAHATALPQLLKGLEDADCDVRVVTIRELRSLKIASEPVLKALAPACTDKDIDIRVAAVACVGRNMVRSMPLALPILETALKDKSARVRAIAADSLGDAPDSARAVPALICTLEDGDVAVRCAAARGLMSQQRKAVSAIPALTKHLQDGSENVRKAAAEALRWIQEDLELEKQEKNKKK
jgi:HEAT repeat protein